MPTDHHLLPLTDDPSASAATNAVGQPDLPAATVNQGEKLSKKAAKKHKANKQQQQQLQQQQQQLPSQEQLLYQQQQQQLEQDQQQQAGLFDQGQLSQFQAAYNSQQAQQQQQQQTAAAAAAIQPVVDLDSETDSNHDTALTLACAGGHEELVKLLLERGAHIGKE